MLIPIGTNRPIRKPTKVVYWVIGINIAVHIVMVVLEGRSPGLHRDVMESLWLSTPPEVRGVEGIAPDDVAAAVAGPEAEASDYSLKPWGFITYQFLHGGLLHLFGNMLFLWVFGPNIEDRLGRWFFLAFYLLGGVFAGAVHLALGVERAGSAGVTFEWVPPVIGASGSISALTGAYLVLFPKTAVKVLLFFLLIGVFYVPAWVFIAFAIARDLFLQGVSEIGGASGVAHLAHLGGYAFGGAVSFFALWRGVVRREPYDLFTMGRQAQRRRKFRELTAAQGKRAWSSELATDARVRRRERASEARAVSEAGLAEDRAAVSRLVQSGDLEAAAAKYEELLRTHGKHVVGRDAQLAIANHLNATERPSEAATAYRLFLERFRRDHEADRVRLLLALLNAHTLNDPVEASRLIGEVRRSSLSDDELAVLEAVEAEVR